MFKILKLRLYYDIIYLILLVLIVFITFISWKNYLSPMFLDQAREIITPYLLCKDLYLYKDIPYYYGPISPYLISTLLKIFGINFYIFYLIGSVITLINSIIIYKISLFILNKWESCFVSVLFIIQLAYNDLGAFVFPYAYSAIFAHLIFLTIILFICLYHKSLNKKYIYLNAALISILLFIKQDFFISTLIIQLIYLIFSPFLNIYTNTYSLKFYLKGLHIKLILYFLLIFSFLTVLSYYLFSIYFGFSDFNSGIFPFQVSNSFQVIYYFLSMNFGIIFLLKSSISFIILFIAYVLLFYGILWIQKNKSSLLKALKTILIFSILIISLLLLANKYFNFNLIDLTLAYTLMLSDEIYSGSGLWVIIFLIYLLPKLKHDHIYQYCFIVGISSIIVSFRSFFDRQLTSYPLYYLALTLIIFVYFVVKFFPWLTNSVFKLVNSNYKNIFKYTSMLFLFILASLYLLIDVSFFYENKFKVITPYGSFNEYSLDRYYISKLTLATSEYIKNNTKESDKILVYPSLSLVYLYSNRLPACKYFDLFDTIIFSKDEELRTIGYLENNMPVYIVITSDNFNKICSEGSFCAVQNSNNLLKWIKSNYHIENRCYINNFSWFINIYKKN